MSSSATSEAKGQYLMCGATEVSKHRRQVRRQAERQVPPWDARFETSAIVHDSLAEEVDTKPNIIKAVGARVSASELHKSGSHIMHGCQPRLIVEHRDKPRLLVITYELYHMGFSM